MTEVGPAPAEAAPAPAAATSGSTPPHALRNTSGWFLGGEALGSLFIGFFVPDLILGDQPEPSCANGWCGVSGFDRALNRAFLAPNPKLAGAISHVFTVGLVPAVGLAGLIVPAILEKQGWYGLQDFVIVLDAFLISTGFNSIAKATARRQRPAYTFGREADTEAAEHEGEEFLSFYSGDTTWAFTLAGAVSTLAFLRGYDHATYLAIGTGALALTGSLLRMAADMHWSTDVMVGMLTGSAIGIGLPLLLHGRKPGAGGVTLVPMITPRQKSVALAFSW